MGGLGLHKGHHFGTLYQPAVYLVFEYRGFTRRTQPLARDHPHAANAVLVRLAHEAAQRLAGFVGAQPVQINLALNRPFSTAQVLHHIWPHPHAAKAQALIGLEQAADIDQVAHGLLQGLYFVQLVLQQGFGWRRRRAHMGFAVGAQGFYRTDCSAKQVLLLPRTALLQSALGGGLARVLLAGGNFFLHLLEFGQRMHGEWLHSKPCSAIDRAWPGATMM